MEDLFYTKLIMASFAIALITIPMAVEFAIGRIKRKINSLKRYHLRIDIRTSTGSCITYDRFYRSKALAIIAAWWYGPWPKQSWISSIHTSINECNG